jgi:hypothetical protein
MKTISNEINLLTGYEDEATKISIYLTHENLELSRNFLKGLRATAFRFLNVQGECDLKHELELTIKGPVMQLLSSASPKGVAIFVSRKLIKIIPLPFGVPTRVIVSKSFHIKPLKYLEDFQSATIVHFDEKGANFFQMNIDGIKHIDTILPPSVCSPPLDYWPYKLNREDTKNFISIIGRELPKDGLVIISSAPKGLMSAKEVWKKFTPHCHLDTFDFGASRSRVFEEIKRMVRFYQLKLKKNLMEEFQSAGKVYTDPQEILAELTQGKISRLCVALEAMKWGVIDSKTQSITYRRMQTDHLDEDILDDLIEYGLKSGIKVYVFSSSELPNKVEVLAC